MDVSILMYIFSNQILKKKLSRDIDESDVEWLKVRNVFVRTHECIQLDYLR